VQSESSEHEPVYRCHYQNRWHCDQIR